MCQVNNNNNRNNKSANDGATVCSLTSYQKMIEYTKEDRQVGVY
jgi:hypothetical protein